MRNPFRYFKTSPETSPTKIAQWWGPGVVIEPKTGGRFEEAWTDVNDRELLTSFGAVLCIKPGRELQLSWKDEDWPAFTQVTFRLETDGEQTVFTLIHEGWEGLVGLHVEKLVAKHRAEWSEIIAAFHNIALRETYDHRLKGRERRMS